MKKSKIWDATIGLVLTLYVAGCYFLPSAFPTLEKLELKTYDERSKIRQELDPPPEVAVIAIDEAAIDQLGRWPWPRSRVAALIDKLAVAKPKIIGLNILFSEPEQNLGILEMQGLEEKYRELVASKKIIEKGVSFAEEFSSASVRMDSDSKLQESLRNAQNVLLPLYFTLSNIPGSKPKELPAFFISSSALTHQVASVETPLAAQFGVKASHPLEAFAEASMGTGHVNQEVDMDGIVRREILAVQYDDNYYPSYALGLVLAYLGVKPSEAMITPGKQLSAGTRTIALDDENKMAITFLGPAQTFRYHSFHDVMKMEDSVAKDNFAEKIVIVGLTAPGIATLSVTPVAQNFPSVEIVANVIENILKQKFLTRPPWAAQLEMGLIAFVGLFVMLALPRLKALWGAIVSFLILAALLVAGTALFINGEWIKVTYPSVLLGVGYLAIVTKRFLVTEKDKELVEASAIDQAKMLGLSFQGQGLLDVAFDNFRKCPVDESMAQTLYDLGSDFERKRQYAKSVSVYKHIAAKFPKFKDIEEKMKVLTQAAEGAVFGGIGAAKQGGTVMMSGGATKPTLGRYQIEKELGRGAMGVVYLGKDPKINRMVAIKTMMLDEGSDAAQTKEIKERFFREAESAGNLNHPNIVRIFDTGDEQDVSFIAMELLDGADLTGHVTRETLLPPATAMEYIALVADALDYAHAAGIVHRDIKPANIMLLKDGTIRVADFGIARITASSKTATGTVMGTPSYMSPEQVAGKKVDGRSDLFSLTVALYELLTGEKPFKGGEGIGALLFQIANDPHPSPLAANPNLPPGIVAIIDKGLAKKPEERYARGSLLAADLRALIAAVKSGAPQTAPPPPAPAPAAPVTPPPPAPVAVAPSTPPPQETPAAPVPIETVSTIADISSADFSKALAGVSAAAPVSAPAPIISPDATVRLAPAVAAAVESTVKTEVKTLEITSPVAVQLAPTPAPASAQAPAAAPAPTINLDATIKLSPPTDKPA